MIILLDHAADEAALRAVSGRLRDLGLEAVLLQGPRGRAFEVSGPEPGRALALRGAPGVRAILSRRTPLDAGEPLWPHMALRTAILALLLLLLLLALVVLAPPGLGDEAHPDSPPQALGAEWYLRPVALALDAAGAAGRAAGGVLLGVAWLALLLWPFIDRADATTPAGRTIARLVQAGGVLLMLAWLALAVAGGGP